MQTQSTSSCPPTPQQPTVAARLRAPLAAVLLLAPVSGCFFLAAAVVGGALLGGAGSVTYEVAASNPVSSQFAVTPNVASHGDESTKVGVPVDTMTDTVTWVSFDATTACFQYDFNQVYNPEDGAAAPYTDPRSLPDLGFYSEPGGVQPVTISEAVVDEEEVVADRWPHRVQSGSASKCYPSPERCDEVRTEPTYTTEARRTIVRHVRGTGVMCAPSNAIAAGTESIGIQLSSGMASTRFQWTFAAKS